MFNALAGITFGTVGGISQIWHSSDLAEIMYSSRGFEIPYMVYVTSMEQLAFGKWL